MVGSAIWAWLGINAALGNVPSSSGAIAVVAERAHATWLAFTDFIAISYQRSPAVTLVLMAFVLLPPFALIGLYARWRRWYAFRRRAAGMVVAESVTELLGRTPGARGIPHIQLIRPEAGRIDIGSEMLRIGREDDNDLCLDLESVQRYHAIIERAAEDEYVVRDVGDPNGIGVLVNGVRIAAARLVSGDLIDIGGAKVRFAAEAV